MSDYSSFRSSPADYSNTPPHVQANACISSFYPTIDRLGAGTPPAVRGVAQPLPILRLETDDHTFRRRVRIELTTAHLYREIF